jgi:hypothetical protein
MLDLELEIIEQESVTRYAGYRHVISACSRYAGVLIVVMGSIANSYGVMAFGVLIFFAVFANHNYSYNRLKEEEKKLNLMQKELIRQKYPSQN